VAQRGAELGLTLEAAGVEIVAVARVHPLDGHLAVEPLVVREIDGGHPARPEALDHAVPVRE
jgi:hypothetical protein